MEAQSFEQLLSKRILVLDGAMGTMLQNADLKAEDFGGECYEGCNEYLNLTSPGVLEEIHSQYLEAGADIIETNTFGATDLVLDEYDLGHLAEEINVKASQIAKKAAERYSKDGHTRFVAGAMGPTTKTLSVTGGTTFEHLTHSYEEQARGLIKGGVDLLLLETSQDMLNVKAAYIGITRAFRSLKQTLPLMISGTIEPMGTTLAGQNIEAFYLSLEHMKPTVVGLNCATGPEFMRDHIRSLSELATTSVSCYPNAGLPDEEGHYHETPESLAKKVSGFAEKGWLNVVGGCCGTTPEHTRALVEAVRNIKPRKAPSSHPHAVSGIEPFIYEDKNDRPILVGERTNVIGSRKFKRLIAEDKVEGASEIARAQVKKGAQVIDICLADPDRDEVQDMEVFMKQVINKVKAPLVIDSTDVDVIEKALTYSQGKVIINSINLEDGEERFKEVLPLVQQYGAAVVVGTIDEEGMALTAESKLAIAIRSRNILVNEYGLNESDIIFDPLVFPVGTGDEQYIGSANATIEGIRLIKQKLPKCQTILGVSNVSFGLPPVGREVLNAVYLYHCTKAGLDYAIVNTEKLERYASIAEEEIKQANELLFQTTDTTLATFTAFYRGKKKEVKAPTSTMNLPERLAHYVVEGTKEGLIPDLEKALETYPTPLKIINGPLMAGMAEVGRLFNDNQLIVAEVLQSAEVMKTSVAYLEPHMEKGDTSNKKGKILLATVKGDVHDIGKNLVDIILSNNGFDVVDLGIKVTPSDLIKHIHEEKPDVIGLSGLLVKSAQQMVLTAQDLKQQQIELPILVGGAALSRKFTNTKIASQYDGSVFYAKDAMDGLALSNRLSDLEDRELLIREQQEKQAKVIARSHVKAQAQSATAVAEKPVSKVSKTVPVYQPHDFELHILRDYSVAHIEPFINMQMLIGHHLGLKGKFSKLLEEKNNKALQLKEVVDELLVKAQKENWIQPSALYQFFPAQSDGDDVIIYDSVDQQTIIERFTFPRQNRDPYLCLADYLRPVSSGEVDYVGFFSVTAGKGIRERSLDMKQQGEYLKSHALQALALESAEGLAEHIHQLMRDKWGFPDPTDFTMQERFSAKYQGQRYSFGYPACPDLEDQRKLFQLIRPEQIGVELTEECMMEPEASVTAIVFAHPEARYFNVH
ncbi:methionine synthase [Halobacillus amylolyticus]|uniref:Methionine synthase n=1 Tax=Halobacillus amylolyticus TaxID=2932259 RepID=A0ABY4HB98_9BACI|nr:methionine synthase [Halobacillus amylolyticus]UOR12126.1 methionine synthase [Halobacillus amylolyticus]